jgi:RNA polymerase sigma-70 factor (ECF subfamily)
MSALAGAEPPPERPERAHDALDGEGRFDPLAAAPADARHGAEADDAADEAGDDPVLNVQPLLESLVAAAVTGDQAARERLLAEIHPLVLRYCRARLGRQETVMGSADDVAQEVCLAVVNALPGYTLRGLSFRAFVYGIAAHKVTDAFRAIGRNRADPMAELPDAALLNDGPEQRLLSGELTERLGLLLNRLTPRQREVLVLRIAVGLSAEETAAAVGSTPGAVRVTQHRALNRLRAMMNAAQPDVTAMADDVACDEAGDDGE